MTLLDVINSMLDNMGKMPRKQAVMIIKNRLRELIKKEGVIHVTLDNGEKLIFSEKELAAIWNQIK